MINELFELAEALEKSNIEENIPAQNFPTLAGGLCVCVRLNEGTITQFYEIEQKMKSYIHKYGVTSKGFYPCVKLAPLFLIKDKEATSLINRIKRSPEQLNESYYKQIVGWCREDNNNWDEKVVTRCKKSLCEVSRELLERLADSPYEPLTILTEETDRLCDPMCLHEALTKAALKALSDRENVALALTILFAYASEKNSTKGNHGDLSLLFDADRLLEYGTSVVNTKFSEGLNAALLHSERMSAERKSYNMTDAFNLPYSPMKDAMPEIKLAAGFSVKLRAMNDDVECQHRYGRGGSYTYPASVATRHRLGKALTYIGNKESTWLTISYVEKKPKDVLFAYPLELSRIPQDFVKLFQRSEDKSVAFISQTKRYLSALKTPRLPGADSNADGIRVFVLRRINVDNNSGRVKIVYTRQTNPYELEKQSEAWTAGCLNLPAFAFGQPNVPFPLDAADVLNSFWDQKGKSITDKFRPVPKYHGLELLMDSEYPVTADLHCLAEKTIMVGAHLGHMLAERNLNHHIWDKIKDMLALTGLMLYRKGIGKDAYMESLPYLYGQLLKVSDELHALYCRVVRNGELPTNLAGGNLYQAAAEAPIRTLSLLGQRMNPYILWAKTYRTKNIVKKGKRSSSAGYFLSLYENIAAMLVKTWDTNKRFNDEEKAMLFLGYLSALPQKEQAEDGAVDINKNTKEENDNE